MGNCFTLCYKPITRFCTGYIPADQNSVLQIIRPDGKVMEYKTPIRVKDVLVNFSGFLISTSEKASDQLPADYQLQIGKVYYFTSSSREKEQTGGCKRIKLVITKQQLQDLLSKQISVGEILAGNVNGKFQSLDFSRNWKPNLEPITE